MCDMMMMMSPGALWMRVSVTWLYVDSAHSSHRSVGYEALRMPNRCHGLFLKLWAAKRAACSCGDSQY